MNFHFKTMDESGGSGSVEEISPKRAGISDFLKVFMTTRTWLKVFVAVLFFLGLQACPYKAWYEGFQENQGRECYNHREPNGIQKCIDDMNSITYEIYKRTQGKSKKLSNQE
jgi:hypothetical protein